nr:MAG TPA: hypothetical protein [Siphoviridae sp. ctHdl3]
MSINNNTLAVPSWYSSKTCYHKVCLYLRFAQWSIRLARMARGTIHADKIAGYLADAQQERTTAATYYAAYLARCGCAVIESAPAVDYTVWSW